MCIRDRFGIDVHAIVDVTDIRAYLKEAGGYEEVLRLMESYMEQYCVF